MRKRFFALSLFLVLFYAFSLTASAATLEEEGRALFTATYEIFASGTFTCRSKSDFWGSMTIVMDGNNRRVEEGERDPGLQRLLLGKRSRIIMTPGEEIIRVFPDRRVYCVTSERVPEAFNWGPIGIPEKLDVSEKTISGKKYICVSYPHNDGYFDRTVSHLYLEGQLKRIEEETAQSSRIYVAEVLELNPTADESYFSTRGMLEIPSWLYRLLDF